MHRERARRRALLALVAGMAVAGVVASPAAGASGRTQIQIQDRCDPATFNVVLGDGACVPTRRGDVTFEEFFEELNPDDGGHGAWRFTRQDTHIDHGDTVHVRNTGGEFHTFTEVADFGAGFFPELNAALPPGTAAVEPVEDVNGSFLPPGASRSISGLTPGEHLFECLIHPWMRSTVEVRPHH